jgi:6-phosphogluconolactonase
MSFLVYVSCSERREIMRYRMSSETGQLTELGTTPVPGTDIPSPHSMPLAITPDRRFLYAALRTPPYPVVSFGVDLGSGDLRQLGTADLPDNVCYIITDRTGRHLLSASHSGSRIISTPIDDKGVAGIADQIVEDVSHAHSIVVSPDNRFAYAAALGSNVIRQYRLDAATGHVTPNDPAAATPQDRAGPRHVAFHPKAPVFYCINETDGTINVYGIDREKGLLTERQSVNAMPADHRKTKNERTADIHVTPDGRYLYGSERTNNTFAAFAVEAETGKLTRIGTFPAPPEPRGFRIDPSGRFLIVAGRISARIEVWNIDPATGMLSLLATYPTSGGPNWVEIIPAE